jgi:SAM-dependent methyltransferase
MSKPDGETLWRQVTDLLGQGAKRLGPETSRLLREDPLALAALLARYKFAAKMAVRDRPVLELGCGEGLGARILAEPAGAYLGVDTSGPALAAARDAFGSGTCRFQETGSLDQVFGAFGTVVCLDAARLPPGPGLARILAASTEEHGRCILGAPGPDPLAPLGARFRRVLRFALAQGLLVPGHPDGADCFLAIGCSPLPGGGLP